MVRCPQKRRLSWARRRSSVRDIFGSDRNAAEHGHAVYTLISAGFDCRRFDANGCAAWHCWAGLDQCELKSLSLPG